MSALGRNNTDKVSQDIQYQTAALFTTYSWGGASVSYIKLVGAGSFELPAQAKLAVVFTIASMADFCGYLWCARCYVAAPLKMRSTRLMEIKMWKYILLSFIAKTLSKNM